MKISEMIDVKGKTQLDLARHLGLSPSQTSAIMLGRYKVSLERAVRMACFYGVSLDAMALAIERVRAAPEPPGRRGRG